MKIYGYGRSRWVKCIWMLNELGIDYEEYTVKYKNGKFGDEAYAKINPFNLVPALEDGDIKLFDSQAIVNYLGEKHPEHELIPKSGTKNRAMYDQWTFFCSSTLEGTLWNWFRHSFIFDDKNQQEITRASLEVKKYFKKLNSIIKDNKYLIGNSFSAADISMAYLLHWAELGAFLKEHENLIKYKNIHIERDTFPHHLYVKK